MPSRPTPSHAIVTGGSSGIGLALAHMLAARGMHVTIVARNAERLAAAQTAITGSRASDAQRVLALPADVASEAATRAAMTRAIDELGAPDLLITSAGAGGFVGRFEDAPLHEFEHVMAVNYLGSVYCARAVLPVMRARRKGHVCFVSSGAALIGVYGYSVYAPTKFALRGLADVLRSELKQDDVRVSIVYPPDTDTPMLQEEIATAPPETRAISAAAGLWTADAVARATLRGLDAKRFEIPIGAELSALLHFRGIAATGINWYLDRLITQSRRAARNAPPTGPASSSTSSR
jgi:3-dehydrosphinganine reductase